jgi:hypothetical protein
LATAHTASMSMQALSSVFGDRIISSGIWPACLPDLNPSDFFFWGRLKNKFYNITWIEEVKENIPREIANIHAEQLQRVKQNHFHQCEDM